MLDNSKLVARFVPESDDGDTFIYTEMLDRGQRKGNNGNRLVKTFYHRSQQEFWTQWPTIVHLCDISQVRACTRLAKRSWKKVGKEFTRLVIETALTENWLGMKSLYNRACGIATPVEKLWLFDVDVVDASSQLFEKWLKLSGNYVVTIPSKKGLHYISKPFNSNGTPAQARGNGVLDQHPNIQLHKDNPTNLYIPEGAD